MIIITYKNLKLNLGKLTSCNVEQKWVLRIQNLNFLKKVKIIFNRNHISNKKFLNILNIKV